MYFITVSCIFLVFSGVFLRFPAFSGGKVFSCLSSNRGKSVKLRKTHQNTEGRNGKFSLNIISAIYVFKMISYLKYCFFAIHSNCKTFLYMQQ